MLQLVGLGLADETDVTVKGLELIKKAERVYLEAYTSILLVDAAKLVSTASSRDMLPGHLPWASSLGALMQVRKAKRWPCTVGSILWPFPHHRRPRDGRIVQ